MRLFIALELPEKLRPQAVRILDYYLQSYPKGIKWAAAENLHFTLQFIGDVNSAQQTVISERLDDIFAELPSFDIYTPKIEVFPPPAANRGRPRLVWTRFSYHSPELTAAIAKIRSLMQELSLSYDDRSFKMHLTFGRIKKTDLTDNQLNDIESQTIKAENYRINEAALYESRLYPQGPQYIKLNSYSLNNA